MKFHFSKFQSSPYKKQHDKEGKTIAELAAIFFGTPTDELERSLVNNDNVPDDQGKE